MDVTALLVFVSCFVGCAGVVFLISTFGAKEETFEEALAKQRKANEKEKKTKEKNKKENDNKKSKNWRMKKKGERDDKNDGLDEEEEQVVLVPAGAKIEDVVEPKVVAEERVPEQVPESKPVTKKEKNKKNKIEIKEVEAEVESKDAETVPPVVEAAPVIEENPAPAQVEEKAVKSSPAKQKARKEKTPETVVAAPVAPNPKELLSIVKKTAFNDVEAQKLIDVLLTKQSGDALNTSDEWIEKGKPTESQKLKQELTETLHSLEDERMKVKSFTEKLTNMRKELNEEKSARASHNRVIDDIRKSAGQEVSALNSRLQQVMADNNLLQNNLQSEVALRRNIEMGQQSHYQATIDQLNQQLAGAKMAAAQAKANDPHLLTELEQLRTLRDKYEKTLAEININNSNLKNQINQQSEELTSMKKQLSSSSDKVSQLNSSNSSLEKALAAKTEEANKTSNELKSLKSKPQAPAVINNNNINVEKVEAELASVKQKLIEKEQETKRLMEENERLSEQVASSVERPAAEGEEANGAVVNGHGEAQPADNKSDEWKEKFENLHLEHEKMLAKQKVIQSDFDAEVSKIKEQLETMKSKNNDLSSSLSNEKQKACSELIVRLFPSLSGSDHDSLEEGAKAALETFSRGEAQVAHYKSVLAQTETMLTALQTSVESVESEWRLKLDAANKEISELRSNQTGPTSHIKESQQEVERLSQELSESKKKQDELTKQVSELKITNGSLKDLVDNAQIALTKEQILVKNFQDQVSSSKVENGQSSPETVQ